MEIVVEDPRKEDGTTTYEPAFYRYEEATQMWSLLIEQNGVEVERKVPRERVVYIEKEPDGPSGPR